MNEAYFYFVDHAVLDHAAICGDIQVPPRLSFREAL